MDSVKSRGGGAQPVSLSQPPPRRRESLLLRSKVVSLSPARHARPPDVIGSSLTRTGPAPPAHDAGGVQMFSMVGRFRFRSFTDAEQQSLMQRIEQDAVPIIRESAGFRDVRLVVRP